MCDQGRGAGVEIIAMAIHIKTVQEGQEFDDWGQKRHRRPEENGLLRCAESTSGDWVTPLTFRRAIICTFSNTDVKNGSTRGRKTLTGTSSLHPVNQANYWESLPE